LQGTKEQKIARGEILAFTDADTICKKIGYQEFLKNLKKIKI
jgi:hypothetical protein